MQQLNAVYIGPLVVSLLGKTQGVHADNHRKRPGRTSMSPHLMDPLTNTAPLSSAEQQSQHREMSPSPGIRLEPMRLWSREKSVPI